jgi:hypothetical protein
MVWRSWLSARVSAHIGDREKHAPSEGNHRPEVVGERDSCGSRARPPTSALG